LPPLSHLTSCTTTKSNLYLANSLAVAVMEHDLYRLLTFQVQFHIPFPLLRSYQRIIPTSRQQFIFPNMKRFYGEELLAPRPTPKLEDHHMSAVRDCLFNIFAATLHIGGCSFIRYLRTCHAVVTGTNLSWVLLHSCQKYSKQKH
jgi:hypothetical protein